jgi:GDPmannose 4,6-dehydratase
MPKKALITGCNSQDGSYLSELLLEKGYEVHGMVRRHSVSENQSFRLNHIKENLTLHYGDLTDALNVFSLIKTIEPDEIYNLGAQSHVKISFEIPAYTFQTNANGFLNVLESARIINSNIKIYQASTSEMFGNNSDSDGYQRIDTKMSPVSPYGCSKFAAHNLAINYRHAYNMFIASGILFNHESPRRGINFVTAKVVEGAIKIKHGLSKNLSLGNLNASRDWGHAKDYVNAMWLMLQNNKPTDYVVSTGYSHTISELCDYVFSKLDMNYNDHVIIDPIYYRPEELNDLKGDSTPIRNELGWKSSYNFESLLDEMIQFELSKY